MRLAELKTERHVIENGHVRIKRIVLEHHCDVSVLGSDVVDKAVADKKLALGDFFKSRDHTQSGGLSASGRTDEDNELLVSYLKTKVGNGGYSARILFINVFE